MLGTTQDYLYKQQQQQQQQHQQQQFIPTVPMRPLQPQAATALQQFDIYNHPTYVNANAFPYHCAAVGVGGAVPAMASAADGNDITQVSSCGVFTILVVACEGNKPDS